MKFLSIIMVLVFNASAAINPSAVERVGWGNDEVNVSASGSTTNLKYFQYFDMLPDEISMPIFENMNLSSMGDKKIIVGYGMADPTGKNCKIFLPSETGIGSPVSACLPWWRIERVYQKEQLTVNDLKSFFQSMPRPRAPMLVNYCKKWVPGAVFQGGMVTCTTYYDKFKSTECSANPQQPKCKVNNCGQYLERDCTLVDEVQLPEGQRTLWGAEYTLGRAEPVTETTAKVDLKTKQYVCPAGKIIPYTSCEEETSAMMYPYQCKVDNPATPRDDGEYVYCDKKSPTYDAGGSIVGFNGKCADGRAIICEADTFSETKRTCVAPVYKTSDEVNVKAIQVTRGYTTREIDVYSGQEDIYSSNASCVRSNTVQEARNGVYQARIAGSGQLDDDIYVMRHRSDDTHVKVYCNMQHSAGGQARKLYGGNVVNENNTDASDTLQCIPNSGNYSFDQTVSISASDVVTVQQATEHESAGATSLSSRTHYCSSEVKVDGITIAPATYASMFPYYPPTWGGHPYLNLWENSLGSLGIMFPFAGAYELFFYNKNNEEVANAQINIEDFQSMGNGFLKLNLGAKELLNPVVATPCNTDLWSEFGGGVHGGKSNVNGSACSTPDTGTVRARAIYSFIVKDMLTGQTTRVPLVYPIAYPNRIFASKLKIMEKRKYRCYEQFPAPIPPA